MLQSGCAPHFQSDPQTPTLFGSRRLPKTSDGALLLCFSSYCFFFLEALTCFIRMILVVKERIPAEIGLCKRRNLLLHMSVQSTEPTPVITTTTPGVLWLSLSPPLPFPSPIFGSLKASASPAISNLPPCREQWRCGNTATDSSSLPSVQPSKGVAGIPDKEFPLIETIKFQRRTLTGLA